MLSVQEEERRRIARDLHDDLGQQMTGLHLKLEALRKGVHDPRVEQQVTDIQGFVKQLDHNLDLFTWELRPKALYDLGLPAALEDYVAVWSKNCRIAAEFHAADMPPGRFAAELESNMFRITQEALNNVYKHANAASVDVRLRRRDGDLVLTIEDDGRGFVQTAETHSTGIGLVGIQERAALLNGTVEIESALGHGTTVIVRVPSVLVRAEQP